MIKQKLIKHIIENFIKIFSVYILYSSVLAIILFPMLLIGGIFVFLFYYYDISWILADPTIIFAKDIRVVWLNTYLEWAFIYRNLFIFIKITIFIIGLIFFITALFQLAYGIKNNYGLIQQGIYRHSRHPQNLAIIIMAFPMFIFCGVRMGDIVSWVQFCFLMIIYSDFGDIKLKKKYPEQFQSYYENTGFMFPKILPYHITRFFSVINNKKVCYPLIFALYVLTIFILYQFYLVFPFV